MSQNDSTDRAPQWSDGRDAVTPSPDRAALLLTEGGFDHVQVVLARDATREGLASQLSDLGVSEEAMARLVVRTPEVDPHQLSREDLLYAREIARITLFETDNGVMDVDGRESVVEEVDGGWVVRFDLNLPLTLVGERKPDHIIDSGTPEKVYSSKGQAMAVLVGFYRDLGYIVRDADEIMDSFAEEPSLEREADAASGEGNGAEAEPAHEEGGAEDAPGAEADDAAPVESPAVRRAREGRDGSFHRAVTLDTQMSSEEATAVLAAYHDVLPERIYEFWGWLKDFAGEVTFTEFTLNGSSVVYIEGRDTAGNRVNNSRLKGTTGNPLAHTG